MNAPLRATDWRDTAACRDEDAELWFASDLTGPGARDVQQAKAICGRCPSVDACLTFALNENIGDGIYGGLNEKERASLRRSKTRGARNPRPKKPTQPPPATLEEAFTRRTSRTSDGHVLWYGAPQVKFGGEQHNPLRVAFRLAYGRDPEDPVRRKCDGRLCHAGEHLTDKILRDAEVECGTTAGYARHLRLREATCAPCRRANADGDNRLRWTGTTKALAS
jgi:hypothetical protein